MGERVVTFMFVTVVILYMVHYLICMYRPAPRTTHTRFELSDRLNAVRDALNRSGGKVCCSSKHLKLCSDLGSVFRATKCSPGLTGLHRGSVFTTFADLDELESLLGI